MMQNWTDSFFNNMYWELFMKRTNEQIINEAELIKNFIKNKNIKSILDVCCGVGDIAAQLSKQMSVQATGIEYSSDYVKKSYLKDIIEGDACIMQTNKTYSLVLNWYSSFAYFTQEQNRRLLQNCFNYCEDTFLLETYNSYAVIGDFKSQFIYEKNYDNCDYHIDRICNINSKERLLEQKWEISSNGKKSTHNTHSYLYFPDEIYLLLKSIGFKNIEIYGRNELEITELNIKSPRIIIKAEK